MLGAVIWFSEPSTAHAWCWFREIHYEFGSCDCVADDDGNGAEPRSQQDESARLLTGAKEAPNKHTCTRIQPRFPHL